LTQNIGDIDIVSFTAALFGLLIYFIIYSKVVNDVSVISTSPFWTSRDVTRY